MKTMKTLLAGVAGMAMLAACETYGAETADVAAPDMPAETSSEMADDMASEKVDAAAVEVKSGVDAVALAAAVDAQSDEAKARYDSRHPVETLTFFGIEPGMTVAEALPGGGWYTKILLPYLGPEGTLVGAHYPNEIWELFGGAAGSTEDRIKAVAEWPEKAAAWEIDNPAKIKSVQLTKMPEKADGKLDAVLFIRALHNLNRFEGEGQFMSNTLAETFRVLKPGGVVGVVQHEAPESNPDEWADGSKGYLKKSAVIAAFEGAGFVLEGESDINANAKDMPAGDNGFVWRLPPTLAGTEEGTPERAAMEAVGESNRMTLLFRKPA